MSNHEGIIVIFKKPINSEYSQRIVDAIRLFDGVLSVEPQESDFNSLMAEQRARSDLFNKFLEWWKQ